MARPRKEPLTDLEKLAQKIGDDGEDILRELEGASLEELNKRIAQATQAIVETKAELEANPKYQDVMRDKKYLSEGLSGVKKRQNAIIKISVHYRQCKGAA